MIDNFKSLFQEIDGWEEIQKNSGCVKLSGLGSISAKTFFISGVLQKIQKPTLWLVDDVSQILEILSNIHIWSNIPALAITENTPNSEVANSLAWAAEGKASVVVSSPEILKNKKFISLSETKRLKMTLVSNQPVKLIDFFDSLIGLGYESAVGEIEREGLYLRRGGIVDVFPVGADYPVKIELFGDEIQSMNTFDIQSGKILKSVDSLNLYPVDISGDCNLVDSFKDYSLVLDELSDEYDVDKYDGNKIFNLQPFISEDIYDCNFSAVLRYNSPLGFIGDLKDKIKNKWKFIIFTDDKKLIDKLLKDNSLKEGKDIFIMEKSKTRMSTFHGFNTDSLGFEIFPEGFLNHSLKINLVTEKEIFNLSGAKNKKMEVDAAFLANLNIDDFVVHFDHGIGRFRGIEKKKFSNVTKEYLFIEYANNDKLYIPVDQADKVNKYIGADGIPPRLTRLGSAEWETVVKRGREETLEIAKELLQIFAERDQAKGHKYKKDNDIQVDFEKAFPYEPTDGQIEAVKDVKKDMESERPMDRLICGDVGFGKTEVAMRAAFKAIQNGKQVAFLTPITILADQHFRTLKKRMADFAINVEMISRFRSKTEIAEVLSGLRSGKIDIVVGTHMLLQERIEFKNLGLVIIDEEQRFGVKQKEKLKEMRVQIDILTLTATPIPRTLNLALAGIRDISTITTPPPGRLPIHTEVRRFGLNLIREVIMREMERKGQVYFLHNRVQTIESIAEKLRVLIPEAKFIVAHGQLNSSELEKRIFDFKEGKYDVLISSTIIENGIDLENANTLVVDQAETLGLAQAYQLRGRVGRSKKQAYAYFLYHAQKLRDDAKKRLRAIIEASELGSGFKIAMRDLEIRGAGEILGAKQHGTINSIGVAHFCRMLAKAVEDLKLGRTQMDASEITPETKVELSVSAYLPDEFIPKAMEKIRYYQRLSGLESKEDVVELRNEIEEKYGQMPEEAVNLVKIIKLKMLANAMGVIAIRDMDVNDKEGIEVYLGKKVTPKAIMGLLAYNDHWKIIESKMRIEKSYLGDKWFDEIYKNIEKLKD